MKIRLSDFSENWGEMFQAEAELLKTIFVNQIITFEHFGSTSVQGMKAKPVIAMMCIVKDIEKIDLFNDKMNSLGYDVAGEFQGEDYSEKAGRTGHIISTFNNSLTLKLNAI